MKKTSFLLLLAVCSIFHTSAQTLFTYGKNKVDAADFMRSYNKNNVQVPADREKSIREYLDLYIRARLKVREAYARGYDTLPSLTAEVSNLREQIIDNYMTDPAILDRLTREAFARSQEDLHVAHIYIAYTNPSGVVDTAYAKNKRDEVLRRLAAGEDFSTIADKLSDDPSVKTNHGDLGYITVFTLPYEFENAIYATPVGKNSAVVASKIGYHIFRNLGARKAAGKMKTQQILLAFAPGADEAARQNIARLADSLYKRIMSGENFNTLATRYSNDYVSAATGGNIPDVGVGEYDPVFEKHVFALQTDGEVSRPFLTSHGWHIVKRVVAKPVVADSSDKEYRQELQRRIMADGRWKTANDFIYEKVARDAGFEIHPFDEQALWYYSDSLLDMRPMGEPGRALSNSTPLFSIGKTTYDAGAWINFSRANRFKRDGSGKKNYHELWDEWVHNTMVNYYRDHLEEFNPEFRNQMTEFREGNMFFEIMQQEVWNKAQNDSAALVSLFRKNKDHYNWIRSADVALYSCSDEAIAAQVYEEVKQHPEDWKTFREKYSERVTVDSNRYEWSQIPGIGTTQPAAGTITDLVTNTLDNTASFAYIFKIYPQPVPRSFAEARGLVINDYQEQLEKEWDKKLRKKYPVVINEKVLAGLVK